MSLDHQYRVCVGSIRADTPAEIRDAAIDWAVNDVPDVAGRYDIESGYEVALYNGDAYTEHRGSGRMIGYAMTVRVTVPASQASWLAGTVTRVWPRQGRRLGHDPGHAGTGRGRPELAGAR